jgi:hypothetical protein
MPGVATVVGQVSVGQCVPAMSSIVAKAAADISSKLVGTAAVSAAVSITAPTLAAKLTAATNLVAAIEAEIALSAGLGLPEVKVDLSVMLAVEAQLKAQLDVLLALIDAMATAGVAVISYTGDASQFGTRMQEKVKAFAPGTNAMQAVTFLATEPAVFAALAKVLLVG